MQLQSYTIDAEWRKESQAWIATSEDVPGLCAQADSFEELCEIVADLVPELLVLNGCLQEEEAYDIPLDFIAHKAIYSTGCEWVSFITSCAGFWNQPDVTG